METRMTREDFLEWKRDHRTESWFRALKKEETLVGNVSVDLASVEKTAMRAAYRAGMVEGINRVFTFVPEGAEE